MTDPTPVRDGLKNLNDRLRATGEQVLADVKQQIEDEKPVLPSPNPIDDIRLPEVEQ